MKTLLVTTLVTYILLSACGCAQVQYPAAQTHSQPADTPIVVKQSGGAGMLIAECQSRDYIAQTADYIIEGRVEHVESRWNEANTSIITCTQMRLEKLVKGDPLPGSMVQIQTPGGTVGDITQAVEDQPIFHEGKKVRIYFQKTASDFIIVCAQFGVEDLSGSPSLSGSLVHDEGGGN